MSVEFILLKQRYFAGISYQVCKDKADLQKWVYEFSKHATRDTIQGITDAADNVAEKVMDAVRVLTGQSGSYKKPEPQKDSVESQQRYIAALGDKPFSSLYDIIQSVKKISGPSK